MAPTDQHLLRICLLGFAVVTAGCDRDRGRGGQRGGPRSPGLEPGTTANQTPLRIAAASDLQHALPRLAGRFRQQTGTKCTLTLDASGRLAEQIKAGAPFDVFLAANMKFVSELAAAGLILPESVQPYARGALVLCVHRAVSSQLLGLDDLSRSAIKKIAIANPDYAPYGLVARQALQRAGLWSILEPKIVRADSVRQALIYVSNGDAEAALVSKTLANADAVRVVALDPRLYDPLVQALGIVADTTNPDQARAFVQFVMGVEGQAILQEAGLDPPDQSAEPIPKTTPEIGKPTHPRDPG
jgi:molybdate transport system substrate-binding protein